MSLSAVENSLVRFVFTIVTLVVGLAVEEMLPKVLNVGFPILLACVFFFSSRRALALSVFLAICAGAAEDSISSLPFFTSVSYFLLFLLAVRLTKMPYVLGPFLYPAYQVWLNIWASDLSGNIFTRFFLSIPIGVLTLAAVYFLLDRGMRRVGFDEEG